MLRYHHSRPLEGVVYGEVVGNSEQADPDYLGADYWLEKQVGFFPMFLAVGTTDEDIRMTGYQDNWRVNTSTWYEGNKTKREYRKKGEFPNHVLFSFEDADGVYMDYDNWHIVLNSAYDNYNITDYEKRLIFKPSWSKSKWLKKARGFPHSVQLVTPRLHLPDASIIWVRNNQTKILLESMGFKNVESRRLLLEATN